MNIVHISNDLHTGAPDQTSKPAEEKLLGSDGEPTERETQTSASLEQSADVTEENFSDGPRRFSRTNRTSMLWWKEISGFVAEVLNEKLTFALTLSLKNENA